MINFIKVKITKYHRDKNILPQIIRVAQSSIRYNSSEIDKSQILRDVNSLTLASRDEVENENVESMFYKSSFKHIAAVAEAFERNTGISLESHIVSNFAENSLVFLNILSYIKSESNYFARCLRISMEESERGTDEILLSSVVLLRCEVDMVAVKSCFDSSHGNNATLKQWIDRKTSGNYKNAIFKLIGE